MGLAASAPARLPTIPPPPPLQLPGSAVAADIERTQAIAAAASNQSAGEGYKLSAPTAPA